MSYKYRTIVIIKGERMKKSVPEIVMRISMVLGIALIVTGAIFVSQVKPVNAQQQMVTLCHAAGQEGTLQFTTLTIAYPAALVRRVTSTKMAHRQPGTRTTISAHVTWYHPPPLQ